MPGQGTGMHEMLLLLIHAHIDVHEAMSTSIKGALSVSSLSSNLLQSASIQQTVSNLERANLQWQQIMQVWHCMIM